MKLIIAGSRDINEEKAWGVIVTSVVTMMGMGDDIEEIVSGTARGIDKLGERYARIFNIPLKEMPANWSKHGRTAGHIRNAEMADYADAALIIWDGESKGTKNMMKEMIKRDKPYYLKVIFKDEEKI